MKKFSLEGDKYIILDGAMGTMLQRSGLKLGGIPEELNIDEAGLIEDIHSKYFEAGSDVVYTNTFGCNRKKMAAAKYEVDEMIEAAVKNAKAASKKNGEKLGKDLYVALDIGPIGELLEPNGTLSFEEAYDIFKEQIIAGKNAGVDLVVIETMTDLYEVKAACLAAKENSDLPVISTMTFEKNGRTFTGCSPETYAATIGSLGVDAIGINCSLGPDEIFPIVKKLREYTNLPLVVKANAGLPKPNGDGYDIDADTYAKYVEDLTDVGVKLVGGCCGTDPEYIVKIAELLRDKKVKEEMRKINPAVCSSTKYLEIDRVRSIGERINPTGKKRFKQALVEGDISYILTQAVEQVEAGADILDVNVGLPEIKEEEMMVKVVKAVQSITDVPLQLDSSDAGAMEAGLRVYNGKPIINSVNGEEKSLSKFLPLAKKYGAAIVGLTLDEDGIPDTAQKRLEVAEKILKRAMEIGIPKEDVYIDCLTLTVSAEQKAAKVTLEAIDLIKEKLGLKTVLGVSNISFGLPERDIINSRFLAVALDRGLDLPIINPNAEDIMDTIYVHNVMNGVDEGAEKYIELCVKKREAREREKSQIKMEFVSDSDLANDNENLAYSQKVTDNLETVEGDLVNPREGIFWAISKGLDSEVDKFTHVLLDDYDEMEIINSYLIPALDLVGERFEKGEIFLPQLIKSATASQVGFEIIKTSIAKNDKESISKGAIVLATVKGDIHDIGKNIVKVILENYGYKIYDLGRDVDKETIVKAIKDYNAKVVGLSALMTTTLRSMEDTINAIKEEGLDAKIMVGGAVLTEDYANQIGADFYTKDSKQSVEIAKKIFGS